MILLAVDPSLTKSGLCLWDLARPDDGYLCSTAIPGPTTDQTLDKLADWHRRADLIAARIDEWTLEHAAGPPDVVAIELDLYRPDHHAGTDRQQTLCTYLGGIAHGRRIDVHLVAPQTWKGRKSKAYTQAEMTLLLGRSKAFSSDDESDAAGIAHYMAGLLFRRAILAKATVSHRRERR